MSEKLAIRDAIMAALKRLEYDLWKELQDPDKFTKKQLDLAVEEAQQAIKEAGYVLLYPIQ